jgi:hypothetical protein
MFSVLVWYSVCRTRFKLIYDMNRVLADRPLDVHGQKFLECDDIPGTSIPAASA